MDGSAPDKASASSRRALPIYWSRWATAAVAATAFVYLVVRLNKVLLLFYLALLLALAVNAFVAWLEKRHVSRTLSIAGLALLLVGGLVGVGFWIVPPAVEQAQNLIDNSPQYLERAQRWMTGLLHRYPQLQAQYNAAFGSISFSSVKSVSLLQRVGGWALSLGGLLFNGFLLFSLVLYGLLDPRPLTRAFFDLTPPSYHGRLEATLSRIQEKVAAWAGGTFILMAIVGGMVWVGLLILSVPQALLFGIIAAVGEGIPNLGPVLSAVPPVAVMLLTDPVKAFWVVGLFVVVQQVENNLIVPMVMGNRLNLHPWALIFMILVMGELFGVVGVFLAAPTAAILGVLYDEWVPKPGKAA